jgi:ElaB/YqjD/DUF883 family membrane-anchored ribosome-binding protein
MTDTKNDSQTAATDTLKADRDQLVADLEKLLADAKTLSTDAKSTSQAFITEKAKEVRAQLNDIIYDVKEHSEATKEQAVETIDKIEAGIKEKPWKAIGIAVLAGIVIDRLLRD